MSEVTCSALCMNLLRLRRCTCVKLSYIGDLPLTSARNNTCPNTPKTSLLAEHIVAYPLVRMNHIKWSVVTHCIVSQEKLQLCKGIELHALSNLRTVTINYTLTFKNS